MRNHCTSFAANHQNKNMKSRTHVTDYGSHDLSKLFPFVVAFIVLIFALSLTLFFWKTIDQEVISLNKREVQTDLQKLEEHIELRFRAYNSVLQGIAGLFQSSDAVTRDEWFTYIETIDVKAKLPGIGGIAYAEVMNAQQATAFEQEMRLDPLVDNPEFSIQPPLDTSNEHYIVKYMNSVSGLQSMGGFDFSSETERRRALEEARDTGLVTATRYIEMRRSKMPGFLLTVPVYEKGKTPETVEARRAALKGFIVSSFKMETLLENILAASTPNLDIEIFDGAPSEDLAKVKVFHDSNKDHSLLEEDRAFAAVEVGGKTWTIFMCDEHVVMSERNYFPNIVLGGGIMFSLLTFVILLLLGYSRLRSIHYADRMNRDLKKFRLAVENTDSHIALTDRKGKIVYLNPAFEKAIGQNIAELKNKTLDLLRTDKHKKHLETVLKAMIIDREPFKGELENKRKDGSTYTADVNISPIFDEHNKLIGYIDVEEDVSKRKNREEILTKHNEELAKLNKLMVGRELKMVELKKALNQKENPKKSSKKKKK